MIPIEDVNHPIFAPSETRNRLEEVVEGRVRYTRVVEYQHERKMKLSPGDVVVFYDLSGADIEMATQRLRQVHGPNDDILILNIQFKGRNRIGAVFERKDRGNLLDYLNINGYEIAAYRLAEELARIDAKYGLTP